MNYSIMQTDRSRCYLCGGRAEWADPLDEHHVFGDALKKKSEKYGLLVSLHHFKCHIFGQEAAHTNARVDRKLKEDAQRKAMEVHNLDIDGFRKIFYKNYL